MKIGFKKIPEVVSDQVDSNNLRLLNVNVDF